MNPVVPLYDRISPNYNFLVIKLIHFSAGDDSVMFLFYWEVAKYDMKKRDLGQLRIDTVTILLLPTFLLRNVISFPDTDAKLSTITKL